MQVPVHGVSGYFVARFVAVPAPVILKDIVEVVSLVPRGKFQRGFVNRSGKSQFYEWQRSFVRACLNAPRRRRGSMGLLPLASCTVPPVSLCLLRTFTR